MAGILCGQEEEQEKSAGGGPGWARALAILPPTSLTGHPSFLPAVIRGVTTKDLYPEFGLDMND